MHIKRPLCVFCLAFLVITLMTTYLGWRWAIDYAPLEGETVVLKGKVTEKEWTESFDTKALQLTIKDVTFYGEQDINNLLSNKMKQILCTINIPESGNESTETTIKIGNELVIEGKVSNFSGATNPGQFDFKKYYERQGYVFALEKGKILWKGENYNHQQEFLYQLRQDLGDVLNTYLSEEDSGVMHAMMMGDKGKLDSTLKGLYQRNGIAHVLAISGLHISLLGMGLFQFLRKVGVNLKIAAIVSIFILWNYGVMTGLGTSTARAVIMFIIMVCSKVLLRTYDMLTAMAVAAVILLVGNPLLVFDVSFQLSFMAIVGVGVTIPALQKLAYFAQYKDNKKGGFSHQVLQKLISCPYKMLQVVLSSAGITLTTMPIVLYHFYEIPLYAILLNLLIIPLMSILLLCTIFLCASAYVFPPVAYILSYPIEWILYVYKESCYFTEKIPGGMETFGRPELWKIVVYYAIFILVIRYVDKLPPVIGGMGIALALSVFTLHLPVFTITMLDIGQGDCIVIETKEGQVCMIDGGSTTESKVGQYRIMPYLKSRGIEKIDVIFLTHMDADHINGIEEVINMSAEQNLEIGQVVFPSIKEKDEAYLNMEQVAAENGVNVSSMIAGDVWKTDEVSFRCIHPYEGECFTNRNNTSLVLAMKYGTFDALFTGDLEKEGEKMIIENVTASHYELLKIGHHGSDTSSTEEFFVWCKPMLGLISCGEGNKYGHPNDGILERLSAYDIPYLITTQSGAIQVEVKESGEMEIKEFIK